MGRDLFPVETDRSVKIVLTKVFPAALAVAVAVGALTELAFTRSKPLNVADAPTDSETALVTISGRVTPAGPNIFILRDNTGCAEVRTCPPWYRRIRLDHSESVTVIGEVIRNEKPPPGRLYSLAAYRILRQGRPEVVIRRTPGKPPWALSGFAPPGPVGAR